MVENFIRTIIDQLAKSILSCGGEWDDYLKHVASAYNTSVHVCTGYTPYYLTHGREAWAPVNVLSPIHADPNLPFSHDDFVCDLVERLEVAFAITRQSAAVSHENQKLYHDSKSRHKPYSKGNLVWLHNPMKLAPHWRGPFKVTSVLDSGSVPGLTYRTKDPLVDDGLELVVHYDGLKPYILQ